MKLFGGIIRPLERKMILVKDMKQFSDIVNQKIIILIKIQNI
jgi:hypothetical protein